MLRASKSPRWAHWYPDLGILAIGAALLIASSFAVGMWLGFEGQSSRPTTCPFVESEFNNLNSAADKARTVGDQGKFSFLMGEAAATVTGNSDCFDAPTLSSWQSLSTKYTQ